MKKLPVILFILFAASTAFAEDRPTLVYDKRDDSVISVGYFVPNDTTPFQGVEYLKSEMPKERLDFYKRTAPGVISPKTQAEKDAIREKEKPATEQGFKDKYAALNTDKERLDLLAKTVGKLVTSLKDQDLK